jgi:hypothetical protein
MNLDFCHGFSPVLKTIKTARFFAAAMVAILPAIANELLTAVPADR